MHGSAEFRAGKLFVTSVSSGADSSYAWTLVGHAVLDAYTLNGTLETMGVAHNRTNPDPEHSYTDYDGPFTMTFTACP